MIKISFINEVNDEMSLLSDLGFTSNSDDEKLSGKLLLAKGKMTMIGVVILLFFIIVLLHTL